MNVQNIEVTSHKSFTGKMIILYKRFIRKSSFWLLNPLIIRWHDSQKLLLDLQENVFNRLDEVMTDYKKQQHELVELKKAIKKLELNKDKEKCVL